MRRLIYPLLACVLVALVSAKAEAQYGGLFPNSGLVPGLAQGTWCSAAAYDGVWAFAYSGYDVFTTCNVVRNAADPDTCVGGNRCDDNGTCSATTISSDGFDLTSSRYRFHGQFPEGAFDARLYAWRSDLRCWPALASFTGLLTTRSVQLNGRPGRTTANPAT